MIAPNKRGESGRAYKRGAIVAARTDRGWSDSISNLCAGGLSHPKSPSAGPAVLPNFPPQGHPFAVAPNGGNGTAPQFPKITRRRPTPFGRQIACESLSLAKPDQPGSFELREVSKSDPMVGVFHPRKMEHPNVQVVASDHVNPRRQSRA